MDEATCDIANTRALDVRPYQTKKIFDFRNFDQLRYTAQDGTTGVFAWVRLEAMATRNNETGEAWVDLQVLVQSYRTWAAEVIVELDFGTQTQVFFTRTLERPVVVKCKEDSGDFFKYPIPAVMYDQLDGIHDWRAKGPANKCA